MLMQHIQVSIRPEQTAAHVAFTDSEAVECRTKFLSAAFIGFHF
jgi:hypothetical protein